MRKVILGLALGLLFPALANCAQQTPAASGKGSVVAVDIQSRIIQIDQTVYRMADDVRIFDANDVLASQLVLAPNQKVNYWIKTQALQPVLSKIQIVQGFSSSEMPKH